MSSFGKPDDATLWQWANEPFGMATYEPTHTQRMNGHRPLIVATEAFRKRSPLVYDLMKFISDYVVMTQPQLLVVALWIIHTYCIASVEQTPYLAITSPEMRCGKSRLLEILKLLTYEAWLVSLPSDAVVFRYIDLKTPTMLLDEVDAIFNPKTADKYEGLRALLDNGNQRGAQVARCVGTSNDIAMFSTLCPKAIAGIGSLPATIADRSVPIRMERRKRSEKVSRFRKYQVEPLAKPLVDRMVGWAFDNKPTLHEAHPEMPEELSDRMQEGCECLVAIAEALGCGAEVRAALVALLTTERLDDHDSNRLRLLADIREVFGRYDHSNIATVDLLQCLCEDEAARWHNWYGRGLSANDLSVFLHDYGIGPKTVVLKSGERAKGYRKEWFHEAWSRYLPPG